MKIEYSLWASLSFDWILSSIKNFIPFKKYQQRLNSFGTSLNVAASITHHNHYFHLIKNSVVISELPITIATEFWRMPKSIMYSHMLELAMKDLVSASFGESLTTLTKRNQLYLLLLMSPRLFHLNLLTMNFASNSILDDWGHPLPDFPWSHGAQIFILKI